MAQLRDEASIHCLGGGEVPEWSGRVEFLDDDCTVALVRLHVSDTRSISIAGFVHTEYYEELEGDCEHHIFRRVI